MTRDVVVRPAAQKALQRLAPPMRRRDTNPLHRDNLDESVVTHRFDLKFRVTLSYDENDRMWFADCLDLQGCHTVGDTEAEALDNLAEVVLDRVAAGLDYVGGKPSTVHRMACTCAHRRT